MNKYLVSLFVLSVALLSFSCKSKQQTVSLSGAYSEAGRQNSAYAKKTAPVAGNIYDEPAYGGDMAAQPVVKAEKVVALPVEKIEEPEEVRDEKFTLDVDEKNTAAINYKYHVVVGSFKNRDNAKRLQQNLNNEGNNAVIVVNEHGMYRVLLQSFNEYQDARGKINQINNRFADAWVLVQRQ